MLTCTLKICSNQDTCPHTVQWCTHIETLVQVHLQKHKQYTRTKILHNETKTDLAWKVKFTIGNTPANCISWRNHRRWQMGREWMSQLPYGQLTTPLLGIDLTNMQTLTRKEPQCWTEHPSSKPKAITTGCWELIIIYTNRQTGPMWHTLAMIWSGHCGIAQMWICHLYNEEDYQEWEHRGCPGGWCTIRIQQSELHSNPTASPSLWPLPRAPAIFNTVCAQTIRGLNFCGFHGSEHHPRTV